MLSTLEVLSTIIAVTLGAPDRMNLSMRLAQRKPNKEDTKCVEELLSAAFETMKPC